MNALLFVVVVDADDRQRCLANTMYATTLVVNVNAIANHFAVHGSPTMWKDPTSAVFLWLWSSACAYYFFDTGVRMTDSNQW